MTFVGKCYENSMGKKITSWESLMMSMSKFPSHMQCAKINLLMTVLTLVLKTKKNWKCKTFIRESVGGNCTHATLLTAVCCINSHTCK